MSDAQILQPGKSQVKVTHYPGTNAFPAPAMIGSPGEVNFFAGGGLTKLEWMAGTIAAGLFTGSVENMAEFVSGVVDLSQTILDECATRQKPRNGLNGHG